MEEILANEYFEDIEETSGFNDRLVLRLRSKPKKSPFFRYLIVLLDSENIINSKLPVFDIFYLNKLNNYKSIIKQIKKLNRINLGIEIKIRDVQIVPLVKSENG